MHVRLARPHRASPGGRDTTLVMPPASSPSPARPLWIAAGLLLVGLAIVGALLPVMPSTVFALGAAACFARSSPRLERWLLAHPTLGPPVQAWRAHRAIPTRAKIVAIGSMVGSGVVTALTAPPAVAAGVGGVLLASALYVGTRPAGPG